VIDPRAIIAADRSLSVDRVPGLHSYFHPLLRSGASADVLVADPVIGAWTLGAGWSDLGAGIYAHAAGAAGNLSQANLTIGLRYTMIWRVAGCTAGTVTPQYGTTAGVARAADGTYTSDMTCAGSTALAFVANAAFDGTVELLSIICTSVTQWLDRANPGHGLVQATASLVPYCETGTGMMRLEAGRRMQASSAANNWGFLHRSNSTLVIAVVPRALADFQSIVGTGRTDAVSVGMSLNYMATGAIRVVVANGSGVFPLIHASSAGALAVNRPAIVAARWLSGGNYELWADGARVLNQAPLGAESANDPALPFILNSNASAAAGTESSCASALTFTRALPDGELHRVCRRLAADMRALTGVNFTW
jgi:hypothetical protein